MAYEKGFRVIIYIYVDVQTVWKLNMKVVVPLYFVRSWERLHGQLLGQIHLKVNNKNAEKNVQVVFKL